MKRILLPLFCLCLSACSSDTIEFEPTWDSLSQSEVPEWFRDAKFGIWAHWGPQCVEGSGDWMGRLMYIKGNYAFDFHRENYGHQSVFGFKDIIPFFKGENWKPDSLVKYYKEVGARYFFAMGNHHDNFDLWDSSYQPWNSVNMGPHIDILQDWADAASKYDLPFGISFHADHAWTWYEPSQGADDDGPMAGVKYDGTLTLEDGIGKWWEGYDPQDLYAQNHPQSPGTIRNNSTMWDWPEGDVVPPTPEYNQKFYNRTLEAIYKYKPDLVYFDATVLPLYQVDSLIGLNLLCDFYNHNAKMHNGKSQAIAFGKKLSAEQRKAMVWDVERGAPDSLVDVPWQTCSCLGDWHYSSRVYDGNKYKSAFYVAKMLVDIVSKNGNLLLSVPLKSDGTFDEKEKAILDRFAAWMKVNGESVYGTRPWKIYGEGPLTEPEAKGKGESVYVNATSEDIRFVTKGHTLYATALSWPEDGTLCIRSLGSGSIFRAETIKSVELLGYGAMLFSQTTEGLTVTLPAKQDADILPVLKIN